MTTEKQSSRVQLTESEYSELIRMATRDRYISATFGPGHVTVDLALPQNNWIIQPLALMRHLEPGTEYRE